MTARDTLQCVHEPFGDAFYFGPERLSDRYENDEKARLDSGFSDSTYKTIFDRTRLENTEVGSFPSIALLLKFPLFPFTPRCVFLVHVSLLSCIRSMCLLTEYINPFNHQFTPFDLLSSLKFFTCKQRRILSSKDPFVREDNRLDPVLFRRGVPKCDALITSSKPISFFLDMKRGFAPIATSRFMRGYLHTS